MEEFKSKNRRSFVKKTITASAAIFFLSSFKYAAKKKSKKSTKITIVHTNDMHSHIEPFDKNDKHFPGQGGLIKLASLIKKIRQEHEYVLVLDAGDIFQGTPYFNLYKGEVEFKLMSAIGYDASTMGNHDFDNGLTGFNKMLPHANFPFICSNYDFSNTILKDKTAKFKVIKKGGINIGILGIGIELNGLVPSSLYKETKYLDPYTTANYYAKILKEKHHCKLIICISHLGYKYENKTKPSDINLARKTNNIDLIIGGHTHTFLEKATVHKNSMGKQVLINQAGWGALNLGRVDFHFSKKNSQQIDLEATINHTKNYAKI